MLDISRFCQLFVISIPWSAISYSCFPPALNLLLLSFIDSEPRNLILLELYIKQEQIVLRIILVSKVKSEVVLFLRILYLLGRLNILGIVIMGEYVNFKLVCPVAYLTSPCGCLICISNFMFPPGFFPQPSAYQDIKTILPVT